LHGCWKLQAAAAGGEHREDELKALLVDFG
jgi:hypothetical protein